jgi:hypothetical protein
MGTHESPTAIVFSPHFVVSIVVSADWHLPSRSIVPSPHSTSLQPACSETTAMAITRNRMNPP